MIYRISFQSLTSTSFNTVRKNIVNQKLRILNVKNKYSGSPLNTFFYRKEVTYFSVIFKSVMEKSLIAGNLHTNLEILNLPGGIFLKVTIFQNSHNNKMGFPTIFINGTKILTYNGNILKTLPQHARPHKMRFVYSFLLLTLNRNQ